MKTGHLVGHSIEDKELAHSSHKFHLPIGPTSLAFQLTVETVPVASTRHKKVLYTLWNATRVISPEEIASSWECFSLLLVLLILIASQSMVRLHYEFC